MRLALDAMGGDFAPQVSVEGALLFARSSSGHHVVLVGDEARVSALLPTGSKRLTNLSVAHASDSISMDDSATGVRRKKDASINVAFRLLREKKADAVVSAGHSGAVMASAILELGRLPFLERPAIATLFPALSSHGRCLLLDSGANPECKPHYLLQFAILGDAYMRHVGNIVRPRIGLLSNGEESSKGTSLTREVHTRLQKSGLEFVGYVEGKDLFSGAIDVVVTDGFTGNIALKTTEGAAMAVTGLLRKAISRSRLTEKMGALLLQPVLSGLQKVVDYAEYGGAPLLGINGVGLIAHGNSSALAIKNALSAAVAAAESNLPHHLATALEAAHHSWASSSS